MRLIKFKCQTCALHLCWYLYLISRIGHLQLATCTTHESARERSNAHSKSTTPEPEELSVATAESADVVGLDPMEYLGRFGYLSADFANADPLNSAKELEKAVGNFREFVGIDRSNKIDDTTTKIMMRPRCGNKDIPLGAVSEENKESEDSDVEQQVAVALPKWQTKTGQLTYRIVNYPSRLSKRRAEVDEVFKRAFGIWQAVMPVKFEKSTTGDAQIKIKFVTGEHDCTMSALNNVIGDTPIHAHAFGPSKVEQAGPPKDTLDGEIHFNDHIIWAVDGPNAGRTTQSLLSAAIHQIGHALGLEHSREPKSRMFPIANNQVKLHESDKANIQKIYQASADEDNFFIFGKRRMLDGANQNQNEKLRNMASLEECTKWAQNNRAIATVWNQNNQSCTIKSASQNGQKFTLFTGSGKHLGVYDVYSDNLDSTELESDVLQWLSNGQCDLILKLQDWPAPGKRGYKCKMLKEDDCCTMLLHRDNNQSHSDLIAEKMKATNSSNDS